MRFESKLSLLNRFFICSCNGSIKYSGDEWIIFKYTNQLIMVYINLSVAYKTQKWVNIANLSPEMILFLICVELKCMSPVISVLWRLHVDKLLSTILVGFENIYGALLKSNVSVDVRKTAVWLTVGGLIFDYILTMFVQHMISTELQMSFVEKALLSCSASYICFAFYEYYVAVMFIQWALYKTNESLEKSPTSVKALLSVHAVAMDCLRDVNRSVFGISVLFNSIISKISNIAFTFYVQIFVPVNDNVMRKWGPYLVVLYVCVELQKLFALYFLAYIIEKEALLAVLACVVHYDLFCLFPSYLRFGRRARDDGQKPAAGPEQRWQYYEPAPAVDDVLWTPRPGTDPHTLFRRPTIVVHDYGDYRGTDDRRSHTDYWMDDDYWTEPVKDHDDDDDESWTEVTTEADGGGADGTAGRRESAAAGQVDDGDTCRAPRSPGAAANRECDGVEDDDDEYGYDEDYMAPGEERDDDVF